MTKVHDISDRNLADVPRQLRKLADTLEARDGGIRACMVIIDPVEEPLEIRGFGRDADSLRAIGLLQYASASLTDLLLRASREHTQEPPEPAA